MKNLKAIIKLMLLLWLVLTGLFFFGWLSEAFITKEFPTLNVMEWEEAGRACIVTFYFIAAPVLSARYVID
ncbi:MAG: hypothetical protein GY928_17045 [Colwellia sp.]|nr:hypothetical protein [Colwellia sp.]